MDIYYRGPDHPFSHFFACNITLNGKVFWCAEQAYQFTKAKCVHDCIRMDQIMASTDPFEIKSFGRMVDVPLHQWNMVKGSIMYKIDFQKYQQNPGLKDYLMSTRGRVLIEDVRDPFWGGKSGGRNEAGKILMELRDRFNWSAAAAAAATTTTTTTFFNNAYIIGDSLIGGVQIPGVTTISIPGAKQEFITAAAESIVGVDAKMALIVAGTNDLVLRNGSIGPCNLIVKKYVQWAQRFAATNPNLSIIIFTIFPRTGGAEYPEYLQRKLTKCRLLLLSKLDELPYNVYIADSQQIVEHSDLAVDGLHLSQVGVLHLRNALVEMVNSSL